MENNKQLPFPDVLITKDLVGYTATESPAPIVRQN